MDERFVPLLLQWYAENRRELPWRQDREVYHVWLSEIMLQQTRVEAVKEHYRRFLAQLPSLQALAEAPEDRLLKLWEGLGYYSRARNLQKTARLVLQEHGGVFPRDYAALRRLPGIGPYTAGAICSICYELPCPAVDGNVLRVLSRLDCDDAPVGEEKTRRAAEARLARLYPAGRCGDFTQALMELGATVCLPTGQPRCEVCPLAELCAARARGCQCQYPRKKEKPPRRQEQRTVFLLRRQGLLAVCRRPDKGLLAGLWQLPDVEGALEPQQALAQAEAWGLQPRQLGRVLRREHIFTHVRWELTAYELECAGAGDFAWYSRQQLEQTIGLPTAYRQFLEE